MKAMHLFTEAVLDTVDAMEECGVSTVEALHGYQDAWQHRLQDYITDLLWDDNDPDHAMTVSLSLCNAAQDMANVVMAAIEETQR